MADTRFPSFLRGTGPSSPLPANPQVERVIGVSDPYRGFQLARGVRGERVGLRSRAGSQGPRLTAERGAAAHLSFTRKPVAIAAQINPWTAVHHVEAQPRTVRSSVEMIVATSPIEKIAAGTTADPVSAARSMNEVITTLRPDDVAARRPANRVVSAGSDDRCGVPVTRVTCRRDRGPREQEDQ
jgi:hypothetical protein